MIQTEVVSEKARRLRQLVLAMTILLTFEGLARKAIPQFGTIIFLFKDMLVVWMAFYVLRMPINPVLKSLWYAYIAECVLMIPLIILTAGHDVLLAVFGAKQYLLFPIVGFATFMAFENAKMETIFAFYRRVSFLLLPAVLLAVMQLRLPNSSWLNMSVNGESLGGFSYDGVLRVSSTFSFVAQFCAFLNAQIFVIFIALHGWKNQTSRWKVLTAALLPAILVGSFVTGSRGAVTGNLAIILLALLLGMLKFKARSVLQIGLTMAALYLATFALNYFFPSITKVYFNRDGGHLIGFSAEVKERIYNAYFYLPQGSAYRSYFGAGLGTMSNGVEKVSNYAALLRYHLWTETDFATTIVEGGIYLCVIWYGFRIFVILKTLSHFLTNITPEVAVPVAFCQGFVIILGAFGTLALQPPIAIWWWFGVGTVLLFSWKCIAPPESEEPPDIPQPPPRRKIRGRSLYADVIHTRE